MPGIRVILLGLFVWFRSDLAAHGAAWEMQSQQKKRGEVLRVIYWEVPPLLWKLPVAATEVVVQTISHSQNCQRLHVAMSMLFSGVTSGDTQNLNINWNP